MSHSLRQPHSLRNWPLVRKHIWCKDVLGMWHMCGETNTPDAQRVEKWVVREMARIK